MEEKLWCGVVPSTEPLELVVVILMNEDGFEMCLPLVGGFHGSMKLQMVVVVRHRVGVALRRAQSMMTGFLPYGKHFPSRNKFAHLLGRLSTKMTCRQSVRCQLLGSVHCSDASARTDSISVRRA